MKLKSFDQYLYAQLRDPQFAMLYLHEAYADSAGEFLVALRKYVAANGGIESAAAAAGISRETLATLSDPTASEESSLLLQSVGLGFSLGEARRKKPSGFKKSLAAKSRRKVQAFS